jgi:putative toxin-antitoxin system antitoxin component (TIGR02293 family)
MNQPTAAMEVPTMEPVSAAAQLLGGSALLKSKIRSQIDVHEMLERGISSKAFNHLLAAVKVMNADAVRQAVGVSMRTVQRRQLTPMKPLTADQSGRAWKFAEVLACATDVLGTQDAAERWLQQPAAALDQRRPLELLSTPAGVAMVERLLTRLDHSVYT